MKQNNSQYLVSKFLLFALFPQKNAGDAASIRARLLAISLFVSFFGFSQSKINTFLTPSDSLHAVRKKTVYIAEASAIGAGLIGLNQMWYADYPQSKFHFYNDNSEWMQMDKVGHFY